jgi:hypothetical protein
VTTETVCPYGPRHIYRRTDGSDHDSPEQQAHDRAVREALEDRGYVLIAIRYDRPLAEQVGSIRMYSAQPNARLSGPPLAA